MVADPDILPPRAVLELLRQQIEDHRATRAPTLRRGAVSFGVIGSRDGLTDYFTLFIDESSVRLEARLPAYGLKDPHVVLHATERDLDQITRGGAPADGLAADGDRRLLRLVSRCFADGTDLISLRASA